MKRSTKISRRTLLAGALVAVLSGFTFLEAALAPKADLWPRWQAHDPASTARIDHSYWDRFLKTYLRAGADGVNRVAYGRITEADKKALHGYLASLRLTPIDRYNRGEQMAFWINLYNAITVRLVLVYYPVDSMKDIDVSAGLFGGPWKRKILEVLGEPMSLNDIEHRILRPIWRDPRIHYAVNCASVGCPDLQPVAFTGANAEQLLDYAAGAYINGRRGARVENGNLIVSKIYAWFAEDFGGSEEGVIQHLKRYAKPPLLRALQGIGDIDDYEYDWGLNDLRS